MSTFLSSKNGTKARKPHRCCLCGERIYVGDAQDKRTGVSDGSVWTMHMHPECHAYEQKPGVVDPDWYEDASDSAFSRAEAVADSNRERALTLANSLDEAQAELADDAIALRDMMSERDAAEAELATERAMSKQYRECWCNQCGKIITAMKEDTK